jgi:flagellar FliL protein
MSDGVTAEAGEVKPAKSPMLKIMIMGVLVLLVAGGGAFFFVKKGAKADAGKKETAAPVRAAPIYFKFEPAFVVNFGAEGNTRYLQITVEAMSRVPEVIEAVKVSEPVIRNDLVLLYSSQQYETLVSAEGKEKLRQTTLETIRKAVAEEGAKPETVEGVYFTSFVIQ